MNTYLTDLVTKYKKFGVFVDSEVLLLFIVGSANPGRIGKFSRTAKFEENDFILVSKFIDYFDSKITSPHILTEVSDLLGENNDYHVFLQTYINGAQEKFIASEDVAKSNSYLKFGLADSAIIAAAKDAHLIFTTDNRFYGYLNGMGIDAVNFDALKSDF